MFFQLLEIDNNRLLESEQTRTKVLSAESIEQAPFILLWYYQYLVGYY